MADVSFLNGNPVCGVMLLVPLTSKMTGLDQQSAPKQLINKVPSHMVVVNDKVGTNRCIQLLMISPPYHKQLYASITPQTGPQGYHLIMRNLP